MKVKARRGRQYTLYTALTATLMMAALYLLLGVWPFGGGTTLTGDMNALYLNFFAHFKRFLAGDAGFAYGFYKGLGGNLVGLYATYYASPFNLLVALVPLRWLPVLVAGLLAAKVVLASVFCRVYLAARFPALGLSGVALALCYGFCAYSFAYAQNLMWHDAVLLLPLVCLGLTRMAATGARRVKPGVPLPVADANAAAGQGAGTTLEGAEAAATGAVEQPIPRRSGMVLYTGTLALAIFSNFYTGYMLCIFSTLYFISQMVLRSPAQKQAAGWPGPLLRFAGCSLLAGGMGAALLLPALANINAAKGDVFSFSFSFKPLFPLWQLPHRLLFGNFSAGDVEGHLPFLYCGVLVLVLCGCFFTGKTIRRRDRLAAAGMLLVFLLSFWLEGFDTLWHGLKAPVWFPARYSFIFCFYCVGLAAAALARGAVHRRSLLLSGLVLGVLLALMLAFPAGVPRRYVLATLALAGVFCLPLWLAGFARGRRLRALSAGIVLLAAAELTANGFLITDSFEKYPLDAYQQYVDDGTATVAALEQREGGDGWRLAENTYRSLNDPMLLGYRGISHFASTQDSPAQTVLYALGYRAYGGGGPYLYGNTAFADAVLGLKYLLNSGQRPVPAHWAPAEVDAPLSVYENPYTLPMLFALDGEVPALEAPPGDNLFENQARLYEALTGGALWGAEPTITEQAGQPAGAAYTVTAAQAGYHYLALETPQGTPLEVNGTLLADGYNTEFNSGVVQLGWLEAGEAAVVAFPQWREGLGLEAARGYCLPVDRLEALSEAAAAGAGDFTLADGDVTGTVSAGADGALLFTSIPWDSGWQALVNGQKAECRQVAGGLLVVPLQAGANSVQLRYRAPGSGPAAWVISGLCLALYAALAVWQHTKRKREAAAWRLPS